MRGGMSLSIEIPKCSGIWAPNEFVETPRCRVGVLDPLKTSLTIALTTWTLIMSGYGLSFLTLDTSFLWVFFLACPSVYLTVLVSKSLVHANDSIAALHPEST